MPPTIVKYVNCVPITMTKQIEWDETTMIADMDNMVELVEKTYSINITNPYLDTFHANHIYEWKEIATRLFEDLKTELDSLIEAIEELPNDECETYEVKEE